VRLTVAVLSFVGFVVFLVVLLRPPPSTLIPNLPHTGRKISVVIIPSTPKYNLTAVVLNTGIPILTVAHLEAEFIVVGGGKTADEAVKPLRQKGSHVEFVSGRPTLMHTLSEAFNRAHFSQILVYGDDRVPMSKVISGLVQPVIGGKVDMSMVEYSDKSLLLSLLSYPLAGHLAASSNSTVFSLHTALWQKECHDVSLTASSPSLELLSKCDLDSFSSLGLPLTSPQQDQLRILAQVHLLYWQLHPIWCTLLSLLVCVTIIVVVAWWVWFGKKGHTPSLKTSHTLHSVIV
jgi:hypothetical protein